MNEYSIVHWTSFKSVGNKFAQYPSVQMLKPDGLVIPVYRKKRNSSDVVVHRVLYDRRYIVQKFNNEWLKPLNLSWEEFIAIFQDLPFSENESSGMETTKDAESQE